MNNFYDRDIMQRITQQIERSHRRQLWAARRRACLDVLLFLGCVAAFVLFIWWGLTRLP